MMCWLVVLLCASQVKNFTVRSDKYCAEAGLKIRDSSQRSYAPGHRSRTCSGRISTEHCSSDRIRILQLHSACRQRDPRTLPGELPDAGAVRSGQLDTVLLGRIDPGGPDGKAGPGCATLA